MAFLSRKMFKVAMFIGVPLTVAAGVVSGLLLTGTGRNLLADAAETMTAGPDFGLEIGTISGSSLGGLTVDNVTLRDGKGIWFTAKDITLDWFPTALLKGSFAVEKLTAARISLARLPEAGADEPSRDSSGIGVAVDVGAFDIARIDIAEPVIGAAASLSARGDLRLADLATGIESTLDIDRLDAGGTLDGRFLFRPSDGRLTTTLKASEPPGGLIVRTLDIEGLPAMTVDVDGDGTLDDWNANIIARAGDLTLANGKAQIKAVNDGRRFAYALDASLSQFAPPQARPLLAGNSRLTGAVSVSRDGNIVIEDNRLQARLINADFKGEADPEGRVKSARIVVRVNENQEEPLTVNLGEGQEIKLRSASAGLIAAPEGNLLKVQGEARVDSAATADLGAEAATLEFTAIADPDLTKGLSAVGDFNTTARVEQIITADKALTELIGPLVELKARGNIAGDQIRIADATLKAQAGDLTASGILDADRFGGRFTLNAPELAQLSGLAGRPMAGSLRAEGTAKAEFAAGDIALNIDGTASELVTGIDAADKLIDRTLTLKGGVSQSGGALVFDALALTGRFLSASVDGSIGGDTARLKAVGQVADLSRVSDALSGRINFDAGINGTRRKADVTAELTGTSMSIRDKAFENPVIRFNGSGPVNAPAGKLAVEGNFAGRPINGRGNVAVAQDGGLSIDKLALNYGKSDVSGQLTYTPAGGPSGALTVNAPDLLDFSDLAGVAVEGAVNTQISLNREGDAAILRAKGTARNITVDKIRIGKIAIDGSVNRVFSAPVADGTAKASDIEIDDLKIPTASVRAIADGEKTRGEVAARVRDVDLAAGGSVGIDGEAVTVGLDQASFATRGVKGTLAKPTEVVVENGSARLNKAEIALGKGRVIIDGVAGEALDLTVQMIRLPLSLANAASPDLGASGTANGNITISGPASKPNGRYDLKVAAASVEAMRSAGVGPVNTNLAGTLDNGRLTLKGKLSGRGGLVLDLSGSAPAGADVPIDIAAKGAVPLALANPALAARGGSVSGTLDTNVTVKGAPDAPVIAGTFSTGNATLKDPESGIAITDIRARLAMTDKSFTIEQFSGKTAKGGKISASGQVGLDKAKGNPADIKIVARDFHVQDDRLLTGTLDADLTIKGPATQGPTLGGKVRIKRLDITVPDALPASVQSFDVEHRNASDAVNRQVEALKKRDSGEPSLPVRLNLKIDAANRIFVRGRGLDVLLGGGVGVTGTAEKPNVDGAFKLTRGTLDILGRRMEFSRGTLDFVGTAEPELDFAAQTTTTSTTVIVLVTGPASAPRFEFQSTPELPEDEILAQLIFNQSVSDLSPLQIARLGGEIAKLGGLSSGPGVLGELQQALGIDVLDLSSGAAAAGSYVNDKVYLGVKQTGSETGSAVIDLDLTKQLKARGEFGSDGSSKIGIGVEIEY